MSELITVWRGSDRDDAPVKKYCREFGFPCRTVDGEQMYENTHFRTEEEAWVSIVQSARCAVSNRRSSVQNAIEAMGKAYASLDKSLDRLELVLRMAPGSAVERARGT